MVKDDTGRWHDDGGLFTSKDGGNNGSDEPKAAANPSPKERIGNGLDELHKATRERLNGFLDNYDKAVAAGNNVKYSSRFSKYDEIDDLKSYFINNCVNMTDSEMDEVQAALEHREYIKTVPNIDEWADTLSQGELQSIKFYCGRNAYTLNSNIRNGAVDQMRDDYKQAMHDLDSMVNRFELKQPITVYRGITTDALGTLLGTKIDANNYDSFIGQAFQDKAYLSCSISQNAVDDYVGSTIHSDESTVKLCVDLPAGKGIGAPIDSTSFIPQEQEFLLGRNTKLKIVDIKAESGNYIVRCEYAKNN